MGILSECDKRTGVNSAGVPVNSPTGLKDGFPECSGNQDVNFARLWFLL